MIMKCLPAITIWELWKTRCDAKYGKEFYNTRKTVNNISSTLAGLLKNQFKLINVDPNWDSIVCLMKSKINATNIIQVKWLKPSISFVKINSDGSCKDGYCGGGGVIRDHSGSLVFAYPLNLGQGTSNWAEAKALLYGVQWCISNGHEFILAESDSRLLVDCVNNSSVTPWRILEEVNELKNHMETTGFILNHCFSSPGNILYEYFEELPAKVKGLMTMDRWGVTSFRTRQKKKQDLIWDPP
ncbi:hypothetical protein KY290_014401 [Solanum tuberosum]|uniref:RNase H type-1 domain-containing protein n=1 Tax=Solanum tuberosum TaxID=4113 RepID=A0ABQ7VQ66_SOLTU|nr:hypothetical protein KY289_015668 [Solanum tuberosum]KAH0770420.1 hypothetical protein KY290_014401 [Solanum tuberosum]